MGEHLAHDGEPFGFLDLGVRADIWDGLAELLPECEQGKEQRIGETAERERGRVDRRVGGRDRPGFSAQIGARGRVARPTVLNPLAESRLAPRGEVSHAHDPLRKLAA